MFDVLGGGTPPAELSVKAAGTVSLHGHRSSVVEFVNVGGELKMLMKLFRDLGRAWWRDGAVVAALCLLFLARVLFRLYAQSAAEPDYSGDAGAGLICLVVGCLCATFALTERKSEGGYERTSVAGTCVSGALCLMVFAAGLTALRQGVGQDGLGGLLAAVFTGVMLAYHAMLLASEFRESRAFATARFTVPAAD